MTKHKHTKMEHKPIIGLISTWPVYQGMTIDRYAHSLIQGISSAATERDCNLLLGCGFSVMGNSPERHSFWPVPGPDANFVPVGPWNTDGLIIVPDDLSEEQSQYVGDLLASGFPVIFTTPEGPGPVVAVDNTYGIRQAFTHLWAHGHRQIAFIAGHASAGGDSEERLRAYRDALREADAVEDPRLIAFGKHRYADGAEAMRQILETGAPFTAMMASNDLSCLGAIEALREAGRRIPDDVAVAGFDDILDARSLTPGLTTVRHPTFQLGYQAVTTLLEYIEGRRSGSARVIITPQLIVRQSCGCRTAGEMPTTILGEIERTLGVRELAEVMAKAALIEARNSGLTELEEQSLAWVEAFGVSLTSRNPDLIVNAMQSVLSWAEAKGEDAQLWQAGVAAMQQNLKSLQRLGPESDATATLAMSLLNRARLEIGDQLQKQTTREMLAHMEMTAQLGLMTAELLTALNIAESAEILARHLPKVGIKNALVALYEADEEDEVARGRVVLSAGLPMSHEGRRFAPREFPIPDLYPADELLHLTILPLELDGQTSGFVAFQASNPELCAAIVHNLIAALRASRLYRDALDGRRLAEEANQLKNRFLSMVSHELRTPLSLIVGLSDMVLREQRETSGLKPGIAQDIEQINLSAQHLGRLLGDVLDLTSSEAGQLRILSQPLDLAEVLKVAAGSGEQLAQAKGLAWRSSVPPEGPWVLGDRTRLRQVALNLISNAVKFTEGGEVALTVEKRDGQVTVSVTDTGMGIAPEEQAAIFEEFHRSERSIREGYSGLGLGLAVCKQLMQQHGGMIGVESPVVNGRGSRFYFSLPILSDLPTQNTLTTQPHETVILLTERAEAADDLKQYLEGRGFEVEAYVVGQETDWMAKAVERHPAAVVMEAGLAAKQSWEIIGLLKRQAATENVPVLVYALNEAHNEGELLELNYLLKPLRPEQLTRELERQGLGNQQTVLIVDDDPKILAVHSRIVQQVGYRALQANNGQAAVTVAGQARPNLILLDLMMPEMDGFAVLDRLRAEEATRNIPVIVITGQVLSDEDMERLNRGVAAILSKGLFSADETLARIEAALARQSGLSNTSQRFVRRAIAYIQAHYGEPMSREDIARHIAISGNYLTDCFRQVMGITPMTYLTRYRIQRAQQLLDTTDSSITEIAFESGFSEISHFTRTFKREVGVSPYAYRRGQRPAAAH
jgi:signal transduction histidine kinase/DNA-binding LacI/PurR family transcriptional regulator/DNA-binding response OmpR family regulator